MTEHGRSSGTDIHSAIKKLYLSIVTQQPRSGSHCVSSSHTQTYIFLGSILTLCFHLRTDPNLLRSEFPNELFHVTFSYPMPHSLFLIHNKSIQHSSNIRIKQQ
jgi:hypothetical protein